MLKPYLFQSLKYPYTLPTLPYAYEALEPHFDKETMTVHHQKHHQTYIDTLNAALAQHPEYQNYTLEELLISLASLPATIKAAVQNHGGGHYNHSLFWPLLSPSFEQQPSIMMLDLLIKNFGSFEQFREDFTKAARTCFGSGWAWLCLDKHNNLKIIATANQDNPLSQELRPIIGLDVWEHAYYLKYQNKRMDYVQAWWHIINWHQVDEIYKKALTSIE